MAQARRSLEPREPVKIALIAAMALLSLPVQAQMSNPQTACRSLYLLGEKAPPGCNLMRNGARPDYRRWGEGSGAMVAIPARDHRRPSEYGLYHFDHFGGYNALYGFGR
jgi:hypothetical protein